MKVFPVLLVVALVTAVCTSEFGSAVAQNADSRQIVMADTQLEHVSAVPGSHRYNELYRIRTDDRFRTIYIYCNSSSCYKVYANSNT